MPLEAREYSKRLGVLQPEQLQAALTHFGLGRLLAAEPIPFGLFGQNVFLTSTAGEYVLRGAPHYDWQFPAEQFYARLLREQTNVPVPWPYLYAERADILGWPFVIMPRMPGLQLADPAVVRGLSAADRAGIARALGETLAAMQTATWPLAGRYDPAITDVAPFPEGFAGEIVARIGERLAQARAYNDRTTEADVAWVGDVIARAEEALAEPFVPSFVMKDYKEHNVTVERRAIGWQVSGVFDLMEGCIGDGELSVCRQMCMYLEEDSNLARAFVHAHLAHRPPRPGLAGRLPVYLLRERLSIWEYCQRPAHQPFWEPHLTFREWVAPCLAAIPTLIQGF